VDVRRGLHGAVGLSALPRAALPNAARRGAYIVVLPTQTLLPKIPCGCAARLRDSADSVDLASLTPLSSSSSQARF